jgi:hypothetical protein
MKREATHLATLLPIPLLAGRRPIAYLAFPTAQQECIHACCSCQVLSTVNEPTLRRTHTHFRLRYSGRRTLKRSTIMLGELQETSRKFQRSGARILLAAAVKCRRGCAFVSVGLRFDLGRQLATPSTTPIFVSASHLLSPTPTPLILKPGLARRQGTRSAVS